MTKSPTPEQVRAARIAANLTQRECADRFGYSLTGWQKKEAPIGSVSSRRLTIGEWEMLMLLADQYQKCALARKKK